MAETQDEGNPALIYETVLALDVSPLDWPAAQNPRECLGSRQGRSSGKLPSTCALPSSPGGGTGCQRHLVMEHVNATLHISPFFYFFAERQLPQKVKIEVALPKMETLKWAYTGSAPRLMTPETYPACPLPFFWERGIYGRKSLCRATHLSERAILCAMLFSSTTFRAS